jgi:hypothetical protein
LVGGGTGGDEESCLLAGDLGHVCLESNGRRIVVDIITQSCPGRVDVHLLCRNGHRVRCILVRHFNVKDKIEKDPQMNVLAISFLLAAFSSTWLMERRSSFISS